MNHAPAAMLPTLHDEWKERGWPVADLSVFRMEGDGGDGGSGDGGAGDGGDGGSGDGGAGDGGSTGTAKTAAELQADADKWKSMARKHETAAKANAAAAKELADLKEAQKSDEQKREDRATAAEKTAAESTMRATRLEVALDKGLPKELAGRLQGDTKEEMEADADKLLELVKTNGNGGKPDLGQGARGGAGAAKGDMNQMIRSATGRA